MPASSAASITSASRTEPPGCTTAVAPASAAASRPSRKGKKASLAQAPPRARPAAFSAAIRPASRRFCWPAPMPTAAPSLTSTMVLELTAAPTRQASSKSTHSDSLGARLVTTRKVERSQLTRSGVCTSSPPSMGRTCKPSGEGGGADNKRTLALRANSSKASGSKEGAMTTSVNTGLRASARANGSGRLTATMPPKADTGSQAWALR